ncbi:MAG: 2-oxoacid:acceptor oxidoreductase family protein [Candidatus Omnitrophica bacterium]|nr:2-oxoacid:acceptor oxidoreductase family protein [Candidatus Omnitrophota bacterium]
MKELKIYARAGQGAITSAAILGQALFLEGKYAYAFPNFGAARMGAPMNAFLRFDNKPVRAHCQVYSPDYVVIIEPALTKVLDCFKGLKEEGIVVINIRKGEELPCLDKQRVVGISAEEIALETIGKPFANTPLLGAFAKATGQIKLESMLKAIEMHFSDKKEILEKNLEAARKGYEAVNETAI